MTDLLVTALTAAGMFLVTNIDDLVILTVLFLASRPGSKSNRFNIVAGQYAGISLLTALSIAGAAGLTFIPMQWVGLFGLLPLGLGLWGLVRAIRSSDDQPDKTQFANIGLVSVAGITIANGADNITLYTPMFSSFDLPQTIAAILTFAVLTGVWCLAAERLGSRKQLVTAIEKFGRWAVPLIFIAIGASILIDSGL